MHIALYIGFRELRSRALEIFRGLGVYGSKYPIIRYLGIG